MSYRVVYTEEVTEMNALFFFSELNGLLFPNGESNRVVVVPVSIL